MKYFSLYLYVITGITIAALYIPFFVLLNQQDSSYGTIYNGVKLEGTNFHYTTILYPKMFEIFIFILRIFHLGGDQNIEYSHHRTDMVPRFYILVY